MDFSVEAALLKVKVGLILSLGLAALVLFVGYFVQRRVPFLSRTNVPAAAVGGLMFAGLVFALRAWGVAEVSLDTTLRAPLQTAFFTTIGLGATLGLLHAGGWRMGFFWLLATLTAVVQNVVGMALALALGAPALLGIICGSLTLTGGPATGQAWEKQFAELGITGAGTLIAASAFFGIFVSSLVANPVATALIRRRRLAHEGGKDAAQSEEDEFWALSPTVAPEEVDESRRERAPTKVEVELDAGVVLHNLLLVLLVMGVGAALSQLTKHPSFILPDYIWAMLIAGVVRNVDDRTGWFRLDARAVGVIAGVALALFLAIALMSLELWKIAGLALPMLVILSAQVLVMILYALLVTFPLMGRDYEAAVTAGGHIGFGLGITANAVANMEALVERFAPAPRSFLVVPVVGAFFNDFTNALVIGLFVNLYMYFTR
ncbi:MAG: glutamate:Na+ symporter, family [Acidobacteriota bacterium]|nr:glutamate:Na+ symporter, family [Acidobacteriota bacterium]